MINIPENYKNNVINMFGEIGEKWISAAPNIIDKYIKKFELTNIKILQELTFNIIIFAECKKFGKVILKVSLPSNELLKRETIALKNFNGQGACKCFYSNKNDGIIIIERLEPGKTLHEVNDREERIKAFSKVVASLNNFFSQNIKLPTYREILDRSINISNQNVEKYSSLKHYIEQANQLYQEIENKNLQKFLLHADLHHGNILTTGNNRKAIDPHGFIGERVLETSRFLENEIAKKDLTEENILEAIFLMSKYYGEEKTLLCQALFVDYTLSTCWDIEVNTSVEHINNDINNLNLIYNVMNKLKSKSKILTK